MAADGIHDRAVGIESLNIHVTALRHDEIVDQYATVIRRVHQRRGTPAKTASSIRDVTPSASGDGTDASASLWPPLLLQNSNE